jgi:hypothetical protein
MMHHVSERRIPASLDPRSNLPITGVFILKDGMSRECASKAVGA